MGKNWEEKYGREGCCRTQIGVGEEQIALLDLQQHCFISPGQGHYLWSQGNFLDWDARFVRMS